VVSLLRDDGITFARRIPWVVAFEDASSDLLDKMFEMIFSRGILDVVSLHPDDAAVNIYSYFPFTREACYTFEPVPIFQLVDLSPKNKLRDLYNCSVKVLLFPHPLYIPYPIANVSMFTFSMEEIVRIITQKNMKFYPVYYYALNTSEGVDLLQKNSNLLSFGVPSAENRIERGSAMLFGCVTWCFPTTFDTDHSTYMVTKCFS